MQLLDQQMETAADAATTEQRVKQEQVERPSTASTSMPTPSRRIVR
jgi:hypothetical protein